MLAFRLEAPPRRRRRLDGDLQRVVGEPALRLLLAVFGDRLVDDNQEGVGEPGVEPRRGRRPGQFAVGARHDVVGAEQEIEDLEQRPATAAELLRHHDHRDHRDPWPPRLVGEPPPQPRPFRRIGHEPREEGVERGEVAAFVGCAGGR